MDFFDDWRTDLWNRWQEQIPRLQSLLGRAREGTAIYARVPLFDLRTYSPQSFKPGGRVSRQPEKNHDYTYWLRGAQRPIRMEYRHPHVDLQLQGFFEYAPEQVEYIEFSVAAAIPCQYYYLTQEAGQLTSRRRIFLNGGGDYPAWRNLDVLDRADRFKSDPKNHLIHMEQYNVHDGRIQSGQGYMEGLGISPARYALSYLYSSAGKLEQVVQQWENGQQQTVFAARTAKTLGRLSAELSERIANSVLEALGKLAGGSPLRAVELAFRSVENYLPYVVPCSQQDALDGFTFLLNIDVSRWIQLPGDKFDPDLTEFQERVSKTEKWDAGSKMLRRAARLVNERIASVCPIAEGFVCYAIDWEIEGSEAAEIFIECGADPEQVKRWKHLGWL
jgi:hypothetical protein